MRKQILSIFLILVPFLMTQTPGQQKYDSRIENVTEAQVSGPIPVVFGQKSDGLPETLKVRGIISEISFSRLCGTILWAGTLRIRLMDKIKGYPYENVFVVVNCLEDAQNKKRYLNKVVEMKVSKLYLTYRTLRGADTFYFELINNTINSKGVPFYFTETWSDKFLHKH